MLNPVYEKYKVRKLICPRCNTSFDCNHPTQKYCSDCGKIVKKENNKQYLKQWYIDNVKIDENEYLQEFFKVTTEPKNLTTIGFDEVSKYKSSAYVQVFKCSWKELLKKYNLYDILEKYVVKEYLTSYYENNIKSVFDFCKIHPYINQSIINMIGASNIVKMSGIKGDKSRYTEQQLSNNIYEIYNTISRFPLVSDMQRESKISYSVYYKFYNCKNIKTNEKWNHVLNNILDADEYKTYLIQKKEYINSKAKLGGLGKFNYSEEELEQEFKSVFDNFYAEFDCYPGFKMFDNLSKYNTNTYQKRFKMPWKDICTKYGYVQPKKENKAETVCLSRVAKLLNENYIPQHKWKWLKGTKGGQMSCDGYFESYNLVVEFDGLQHHKEISVYGGSEKLITQQENDRLKDKLLAEHNINLVRIDSRDKWYKEGYLEERLKDYISQSSIKTA